MNILILGHTGMLGHMVAKVFGEKGYNIITTEHRWPSEEFKEFIRETRKDGVVNCIGAIHQRTNEFDINVDLPIWLDQNVGCMIIHPGTDCEIDNDAYGTSKRKASEWIKQNSSRTKIIKTSIIGPELGKSNSFLEWFLSNEDGSEVNGYTNHMWNGNTTLYWAQMADELFRNWWMSDKEIVLHTEPMSKYEMLKVFNDVYERDIVVKEFETDMDVDKCLSGGIQMPPIKEQLMQLKNF